MYKKIILIILLSLTVFPFPVFGKNEYQYEGAMAYSSTDDENFIDTTIFKCNYTTYT